MLGQSRDSAAMRRLADDTAVEARAYLDTVRSLASGEAQESALSVLMVAMSRIVSTGARLAAFSDVLLEDRYEPYSGPEADYEDLHMGLAHLLEGLDEYIEIVDPLVSGELSQESLSNDLTEIAAALGHGLTHYDRDRPTEALWYWQYSFMASWGDRAVSGLRTMVSMLGHIRLDVQVDLSEAVAADAGR